MPNTSATGGILLPENAPKPLEGKELLRFFQQWVVGITGLSGTMVRPRWQTEPANIPDSGQAWAAIGIVTRPSDTFAVEEHDGDGEGKNILRRHEEIHLLCSFYDTGSLGLADSYAAQLRDGVSIAQNREILTLNGMGLVSTTELVTAPVLIKTRWQNRVDLTVIVRREIVREYPVLNILSAEGELHTDGFSEPFIVE